MAEKRDAGMIVYKKKTSNIKKILPAFLGLLILVNSMSVSFAQTDKGLDIVAETGVLINASTGEVLYNKNMNQKMYPASTTKIMTALLVLENLDLSSTVIIDRETSETEGSSIQLLEGEKISVEQLLYALLLKSANDSAVALAKQVAGSVPEFAKMMNARAQALGANNTNFVSPNGLPDDHHYTTAYDLGLIAKEAMKNSEFQKIVITLKYTIPQSNKSDARILQNPNYLLSKYEGATGIKTGYTSEAGRCLVAGAKRGNMELISVVLKSTAAARFSDAISLLDYGFENYKSIVAVKKGDFVGEIRVSRGEVRHAQIDAGESSYLTVPKQTNESTVSTKVLIEGTIRAPITKGQKVGTVEIFQGSTLVGEVDAVVSENVDEGGPLSAIGISDRTTTILGIILLMMIFLYINAVRNRRKRRIRRQRKRFNR